MALVGTRFHVSDNSGAKQVQCIQIVDTKDTSSTLSIGSTVRVSIKQIRPGKHKEKIVKGNIHLGILVELKKKHHRLDGNSFSSSRNAIVLINESNQPIGTRILGIVPYELRKKNFLKLLSLGTTTL